MTRDPAERLARLRRHALRGLAEARADAARAVRCARWLAEHPSQLPEVDAMWLSALRGEGPIADWADRGGPLDGWDDPYWPLHTVLAGHPFPDLNPWSIQPTSPAS
jgi:hypothetical protein